MYADEGIAAQVVQCLLRATSHQSLREKSIWIRLALLRHSGLTMLVLGPESLISAVFQQVALQTL